MKLGRNVEAKYTFEYKSDRLLIMINIPIDYPHTYPTIQLDLFGSSLSNEVADHDLSIISQKYTETLAKFFLSSLSSNTSLTCTSIKSTTALPSERPITPILGRAEKEKNRQEKERDLELKKIGTLGLLLLKAVQLLESLLSDWESLKQKEKDTDQFILEVFALDKL